MTTLARRFAEKHELAFQRRETAIIFSEVGDNFYPASFRCIQENPEWSGRTKKPHQNVKGVKEMQSSNSSDALLMSIFCHPRLRRWKKVGALLGMTIEEPKFGIRANVRLKEGGRDATEIDMELGDAFVEAKLTEADFSEKAEAVVQRYEELPRHFTSNS